jgi:uncharacterized protein (DUF58 family)
MDAAELIRKVRKVEIKTRRLTRNLFTGGYHSAFKGLGMSFSEVRPYQFGDDVRNIDWNVTARSSEPYIKVYEEERELTLMLLVDISGSSFFGSTGQWKQEILTEICAVLAFSAAGNNDKVGLLLFADKPLLFIPPKKDRQHTLRIIRELLNVQPAQRGTNLAAALQYVRNVLKKRSVCFILSDFMAENYEQALRITASRHDCIGILCWDPRERTLPDVNLLQIQDAETGARHWVDTTDPDLRRAYTAEFDARLNRTESYFRRASADLLSLCSTDAYTTALMAFFAQRAHLRTTQ